MKRKNLLFGACVLCIIAAIVVSLLSEIQQHEDTKASYVQGNLTKAVAGLTFDEEVHTGDG